MSSDLKYHSLNHCKYLLKYHVVLVCKYRKPLLIKLGGHVKSIVVDECLRQHWIVVAIEVDRNHLHIMLDVPPNISPLQIIRILKQRTSFEVNKNYTTPKHTLWGSGGFICTTGDASAKVIESYINNQG